MEGVHGSGQVDKEVVLLGVHPVFIDCLGDLVGRIESNICQKIVVVVFVHSVISMSAFGNDFLLDCTQNDFDYQS